MVKYFGKEYDSKLFIDCGWRGWLVRFLAFVSAKLERWIEWHVAHVIAKRQRFSSAAVTELEAALKQQRLRTKLPGVLGLDMQVQESREDRYRARLKLHGSPPTTPEEMRDSRAQAFFAKYMQAGRAGRYRYAREQRFADPEGNFLPIASEPTHDGPKV